MVQPRNYKQALMLLSFRADHNLRTPSSFETVMEVWKRLLVAARRCEDMEQAKTLSLCKALIKRKHESHLRRTCPRCGEAKAQTSEHCQICKRTLYYSDILDEIQITMHAIENPLLTIPDVERRQGQLTLILKQMANGNIGDSFITNKPVSTVQTIARNLGGKVACRTANPKEKDHKKRLWRVWRTDNYSIEETNAIIQKRNAGETVEKPPPWVPPVEVAESEETVSTPGQNARKRRARGSTLQNP